MFFLTSKLKRILLSSGNWCKKSIVVIVDIIVKFCIFIHLFVIKRRNNNIRVNKKKNYSSCANSGAINSFKKIDTNNNYISSLYKYHFDNKKFNFFKINTNINFILKKLNFLLSKWYLYNDYNRLCNSDSNICRNIINNSNSNDVLVLRYNKYRSILLTFLNNDISNDKVKFKVLKSIDIKRSYYIFEKYYSLFRDRDNESLYSTWNYRSLNLDIIYRKYKIDLYRKEKYFNKKFIRYNIIMYLINFLLKYFSFLYKSILYLLVFLVILYLYYIECNRSSVLYLLMDQYVFVKIHDLFNILFFQSFFFFYDFFFKKFFEFDFSFFVLDSYIKIYLKDIYEYLREYTDLGFLFFNGICPLFLWIIDNIDEFINSYFLNIIIPLLQCITLYIIDWITYSFFYSIGDMFYSLLFPYASMYGIGVDFNILFFTNLEFEYKFDLSEKYILYKYINFENWFTEMVSLEYRISIWREHIHNTKLSFRKYYNIYNYIYEKNYGISFINYYLGIQDFFRVFLPSFLPGFLNLLNTVNLLELDIIFNQDDYFNNNFGYNIRSNFFIDTSKIINFDIYNFINNPLCWCFNKLLLFRVTINYSNIFLILDVKSLFFLNDFFFYFYEKYKFINLYFVEIYDFCYSFFLPNLIKIIYTKDISIVYLFNNVIMNLIIDSFEVVSSYLVRYIFIHFENFFLLNNITVCYEILKFRNEYLFLKNITLINNNNNIFLDDFNKLLLYSSFYSNKSYFSMLIDEFFLETEQKISSVMVNNNINSFNLMDSGGGYFVNFGNLDIGFLLIYCFFENIINDIFNSGFIINDNFIKNVNILTFLIKLSFMILSDKHIFIYNFDCFLDNAFIILDYFIINNLFINLCLENTYYLYFSKLVVFFFSLICLDEFYLLDFFKLKFNFKFDRNLYIMMYYFNSSYFNFKNDFFISWYGIISNIDYNPYFSNFYELIESINKNGIFFYKKNIVNNNIYNGYIYINLHSIFLYWNKYVFGLLSDVDKNNIDNLVVILNNNMNNISSNTYWFNIFINFENKFKFCNSDIFDIYLYKFIYKNIFVYDLNYFFLYGDYSFLFYFNEKLNYYNRVFRWNEDGISKLTFFIHRYFIIFFDFIRDEILRLLFSFYSSNNFHIYKFSGLVNFTSGMFNLLFNWMGLSILIGILNILLFLYFTFVLFYNYDIWIHIMKLLFPKDLDFLVRSTDIDKYRSNYFLKGNLSYSTNNIDNNIDFIQSNINRLDVWSLKTEKFIKENYLFNVKRKVSYFLSKLVDMTNFSSIDSKVYEKFSEEEGLTFDDDNSFITKKKVRERENLERYGESKIDNFKKLPKIVVNSIINFLSKFHNYEDSRNWKRLNLLRYDSNLILENDIFYSTWWTFYKNNKYNIHMDNFASINHNMIGMKKIIPYFDRNNIYMDIVNAYYQFSYFPYISNFFPYFPNCRIFSLYSFRLKFFSIYHRYFYKSSTYFLFRPRKASIISYLSNNDKISSFFNFFYPYFVEFFEKYKRVYITIYIIKVYLIILFVLYMYVFDKSFVFFFSIVLFSMLFILIFFSLFKVVKFYLNNNILNFIILENKYFFGFLIFLLCKVFFFSKYNKYFYSNYNKDIYLNKYKLVNEVSSEEIVSIKSNILVFSNLSFNSIILNRSIFLNNVINNFFFSKYLGEVVKNEFILNKNFSYFYLFKYYLSAYDIVYKIKLYCIDDYNKSINDNIFGKKKIWWFYLDRDINGKWITSLNLFHNKFYFCKKREWNNYDSNFITTTIYNIKVVDLLKYFNISVNDKLSLKFFGKNDDCLSKVKINLIEVIR